MAALGTSLYADWKITTVVSQPGTRSVRTEYFKNGQTRTDIHDGPNGELRAVSVIDSKSLRQIIWEMQARAYMVRRLHRTFTGTAGPVIIIEIETKDTGERRTMFGGTARHVIVEERPHTNANGDATQFESRRDGWYIDSESLPPEKRGGAIAVLVAGNERPLVKVNRKGPAENGLVLWEKITSIHAGPDGQREITETTSEVTELFEGHLDNALFTPPPGFQRVISLSRDSALPWGEQVRLDWQWFEDSVSNLFSKSF